MTVLLLAVAGGAGAALRLLVDTAVRARWSGRLPLGTLVVNVSGSLLIGLVTGLVALAPDPEAWRVVLATGLCGGYTTFSTAMVETVRLAERGEVRTALANVGLTLVTTLAAVAAGLGLAALVLR